jgi:hypothetical protein
MYVFVFMSKNCFIFKQYFEMCILGIFYTTFTQLLSVIKELFLKKGSVKSMPIHNI